MSVYVIRALAVLGLTLSVAACGKHGVLLKNSDGTTIAVAVDKEAGSGGE